ncbi:MAG: glycosyltransferase [Gemmatimonadota bacterium]|nr:glycosyltransferase [Gemmatimonadota bacterium]
MRRLPSVLQVSTADVLGGAERIARQLHEAIVSHGGESWLAVGRTEGHVRGALTIPNDSLRSAWTRHWLAVAERLESRGRGMSLAARVARGPVGDPLRWASGQAGIEDFHYPGTYALLDLPPRTPDVLHLHNLHNQYFDVRALPSLSHAVPTVLTLHDQWIVTGHCAHALDCTRWETGCGRCPHLDTYPSLQRDATHYNWSRKHRLVSESALHVAVPSMWLFNLVTRSRMARAFRSLRLIRQGVDLAIFSPGDRVAARARLGLPTDLQRPVVLLLADSLRDGSWKGGAWVREALERFVAKPQGSTAALLAVGGTAGMDWTSSLPIRFVGAVNDDATMAACYRAADVFVHPSRFENYPNAIMESIACGTPVVATAVGGVPEQVRVAESTTVDDATGAMVPSYDAEGLAVAIEQLLTLDGASQARMRAAARADARLRFDAREMVRTYLAWYQHLSSPDARATA